MERFGILSPSLGLKTDFPSIFLNKAAISDGENFMFNQGIIQRFRLRDKLFSPLLPDSILKYHLYEQRAGGANWYLMVLTKRDILYWDNANSRYQFITQKYSTGKASFVNGDATVTFSGGADTANLKAGDFITIGITYSTADTWYEIESITDGTHVELTEEYAEANTGAVDYQARQTYAGAVTDYWSCVTFEDKFYATNNAIDLVQEWPGTNQAVDITGLADKCKYLYVFERHLMAINIISGGNPYPQRTRSSDLGDATEWAAGDATTFNLDSSYPLSGAAKIKGFMILFTEQEIYRVWYAGGTLIFNNENVTTSLGCKAPHSIVEHTGEEGCYFYGNDNRFHFFTGYSWPSISDPIWPLTSAFSPAYEPNIQGLYVSEYNQILWACPSSESSGYLDTLLAYSLDSSLSYRWTKSDVDISCLGSYLSETTYTWATLPFATWDDWPWPRWDSRFELEGAPFILAGGYDGYTYRLYFSDTDAGTAYTSYFRLVTDLAEKGGLHIRKRITEMDIFVKKRSSATLSVKCAENSGGFEDCGAGSISLDEDSDRQILKKHLPCDQSGNWFELEFSASNYYEFLGVIFGFEFVGDR